MRYVGFPALTEKIKQGCQLNGGSPVLKGRLNLDNYSLVG